MKRLPFVQVGATLLALGCANLTGPVGDLDFQFESLGAESPFYTIVAAEATKEVVTVSGVLSTPNLCQNLEARLGGNATEVVLVVEAHGTDEGCAGVVGWFRYRALLIGLPDADHLRVVHAYPETGWATDTVFSRALGRR